MLLKISLFEFLSKKFLSFATFWCYHPCFIISFLGSYSGMNNENMRSLQQEVNSPAASANPDAASAAAEPADNSSEIVSLLQELRPEEIVNMLHKKGIKLTTTPSTTMSEQNIVQQQNVIVMSQNSSQQQQQSSSSQQAVQSRLMSPPAGGVEDDYNVDSIDPSVMEVITEVDGYAAENVRQNLNFSRQNSNSSRQNLLHNQQQSVLHRTAGPASSNQSRGRMDPSVNQSGARTGVINQSGGVLRSSSGKLFSVEKGDVNRNVTGTALVLGKRGRYPS